MQARQWRDECEEALAGAWGCWSPSVQELLNQRGPPWVEGGREGG